jgi:hypothetical protein
MEKNRLNNYCLIRYCFVALMICLNTFFASAQAISGTKTVGTGGDYATLTLAFGAASANGVNGPLVLELLSNYDANAEVFPITASSIPGASLSNMITVRPHGSVLVPLLIASNNATATIDLNGAKYITIDGRSGGSGAGNFLAVENTSTTGAAFRFINDACFNTLKYIETKGVTTSATSGVVLFSTSNATRGNDSNTIANCDIHEGLTLPTNGVFSLGSITNSTINNSENKITDCNIFNCWNTNAEPSFIKLGAGNTAWTITGNSIYQTALRKGKAAMIHYAININNTASGSNFIVSNNFIGGSASLCAGLPYTVQDSNNVNVRFTGIYLNATATGFSTIANNLITNINWKTYSNSAAPQGVWTGIIVSAGLANITSNTIGDMLNNAATITVANANTGGAVVPIASSSATAGTVNITNNSIGGITSYCLTAVQAISFNGIHISGSAGVTGIRNIFQNKIGSEMPGNIIVANKSTAAQAVVGILSTSTATTTINGNKIQNLVNKHAGTTIGQVVGIRTNSGVNTIMNDTIINLYNSSQQANANASAAVIGVLQASTTAGQTISRNIIYSLMSDSITAGAVRVIGICNTGAVTGVNNISANFVHSLVAYSTITATSITGIAIVGGAGNYYNNMIRLGFDTSGAALAIGYNFNGFLETAGTNNFYFNSVYVGGSNIASASNTFAFSSSSVTTSDRFIQNNVFENERSNTTGTAKNYVIVVPNITGLVSNSNIYYHNGTGSILGAVGVTDIALFSNWKIMTGLDGGSAFADPMFINAIGSASQVDLHIQISSASPVEGSGSDISFISEDFDGSLRSGLTPFDIGADAGNFIFNDVIPPAIYLNPAPSTFAITDRVITAKIYDGTGIGTSNLPIVYYKKFAAGTFIPAMGVLTSGISKNGEWSFTLSTTALLGLSGGDSIYYFIVAQDSSMLANIESGPAGIVASSPVSISAEPLLKLNYVIYKGFSGNINVGATETYTSLSGAGGIFEAINNGGLIGNITLTVTSDLTETGLNGLNKYRENGAGNFTVSIVPDMATERLISGAATNSMIRLNGASRLTIDGRVAGSGRYLRFRNTNTSNATFALINDTRRDTIRYCHIEGATTNSSNGVILVGVASNGGNDSLVFANNKISGLTVGTGIPANLIYATGTAAHENKYNSVLNNELFNYDGGYALGIATNSNGNADYWTISNNSIYQTAPRLSDLYGIYIYGGGGHIVSNNNFGGSDANRSGAAMTTSGSFANIGCIATNTVSTIPITISGNIISNLGSLTAGGMVCAIIYGGGAVTIKNNIIGGGMTPSDTIAFGPSTGAGIYYITNFDSLNVFNNKISHLRKYSGAELGAILISPIFGGGNAIIRGNTITNIRANTTTTLVTGGVAAIYLTQGGRNVVDSNFISDIQQTNPSMGAYTVMGICVNTAGNNVISRNKIYDIKALGVGTGGSAPVVSGIRVESAGNTIMNNQISLGSDGNDTKIYGIQDVSTTNNNYYYNSIFINGNMNISGFNNTYCFQRTGASTLAIKNNIFYNKRTTSGSGVNLAFGNNTATGYTTSTLNHNLLIANDTAKMVEFLSNNILGWSGLDSIFNVGGSYNSNWSETTINVPADSLFIDTAICNLGIATNHSQAWYANGKGLAINTITGDFYTTGNIRSGSVSNGATDIGAIEFTPQVGIIPTLTLGDKTPVHGDSTQFIYGGRVVAKAIWGFGGTLPLNVNVRYYSGVNPTNVPAGRTYTNAYWQANATGGSGYTYDLSLLHDASMLGTVSSVSNLSVAKHLTATTWSLLSTVANNSKGTFTSNGLTSFGMFAGTDASNNPLPVKLMLFSATAKANDVLLTWATASEVNNLGFEVERSVDGRSFETVGFVNGAKNSSKTNNYNLVDKNVWSLNVVEVYYRLKQVDLDGRYDYSKIVKVTLAKSRETGVSVYPNPFVNEFNILVNASQNAVATVAIVDLQGRLISTQENNVIEGFNTFTIGNSLNAGIYFVKVTMNNETKTIKLIKQ